MEFCGPSWIITNFALKFDQMWALLDDIEKLNNILEISIDPK